jgi:hypothetical protein
MCRFQGCVATGYSGGYARIIICRFQGGVIIGYAGGYSGMLWAEGCGIIQTTYSDDGTFILKM